MKSFNLTQFPMTELKRRPELLELVYVWVNPIEYHGPHLSLETDYLISLGLAQALHSKLKEFDPKSELSVGSVLGIGVDPAPGPGSVATPLEEVTDAILRVCQSLTELGARRVVFMTFHGSPTHAAAIESGIRFLNRKGIPSLNPMNILMRKMLEFGTQELEGFLFSIPDETARKNAMKNAWYDFHGGLFETSVALHLAPHSVSADYVSLPDCPHPSPVGFLNRFAKAAAKLRQPLLERELEFAAHALAWTRMNPHLGYTGTPRWASAEIGKRIVDYLVDCYAEAAIEVFKNEGSSPKPILQWTVNPVKKVMMMAPALSNR